MAFDYPGINDTARDIYEVFLSKSNQTIYVYNALKFYGKNGNIALAQRIAEDINTAWNEPNAFVEIEDTLYNVLFRFDWDFLEEIEPDLIKNNPYPWRKYFHITESNKLNISFVDGVGSNSGEFMVSNIIKENSKTGAHELGHTFGLDHPKFLDFREKGQPHIMFPRGTLVDRSFRYKPNAEVYSLNGELIVEPGATLNTDLRKVTQFNIECLELDKLDYNKFGKANISRISNIYHE